MFKRRVKVEPTSALTFSDLIVETALKLGTAHYGADGDGEAQVPTDAHDLGECKRLVNNAIRMFINDGPQPNGWRWIRPVASVPVWGPVEADDDNLISFDSYDSDTDKSTLEAETDTFFDTMEEKDIDIDGTTYKITNVVSATQIKVSGDQSALTPSTFSIDNIGNFTLPRDFGGQYVGSITYEANTNRGMPVDWADEVTIRKWRENITSETGVPFWAAVRIMGKTATPRRRWELMLYPNPDELFVMEFPYHLHFDKLVELDEVPPAPFGHDEAIKAACRAMAEKEVDEVPGVEWQYYRQAALPGSYRVDAQSAPKKLGYFYNPSSDSNLGTIQHFRQRMYQRPSVTFNQ